MLGTIAISLAVFMIPAAPLNTLAAEDCLYNEPIICVQQENEETDIIYTPHGSEVIITHPENLVNMNNLHLYTYYFEGGEGYSGWYNNKDGKSVTLKDKGCYRVGDPTTLFNYAAFAFYMYWHEKWDNGFGYISIACSIRNFSPYLDDHSFIDINLLHDEPQINDLVCYVADGQTINIGIIQEVYNSEASDPSSDEEYVKQLSKFRVLSKWGTFGLYEHRGDYCPFISGYNTQLITELSTTEVVYLRKHETHTYTQRYAIVDGNTHKSYCVCGDYETERHTWLRYNRQKYCQYCGYVQQSSGLLDLPTLGDTLNFDFNDIDYKELCK